MTQFEYLPGATPLDPEEIDGLKLRHITTRNELDRWEQENIQEAIGWLARKRKTDILTEEFICILHTKMFGKVWKWAGSLRRTDKNIGVSYLQVRIELRQLLDNTKYWIEKGTLSPDEIAYRFHHKLVWIHLFPNGNGRHSRMMADLILEEIFGKKPFTWGKESLTSASTTRRHYIASLRSADNEDYSALADFVRS
jgi:Fic-DOC domain mobile mystery protein B